jgi:hypothetical protein
LDFLCDLALQCFNNEFIFAEAQAESTQVTELQCAIEATLRDPWVADEQLMRAVATLAMYRPLHAMSGVDALLASEPMSGGVGLLLRRSVRNVLEERRLRSGVRAVDAITETMSQAVRAQYEENPYPRLTACHPFPPPSGLRAKCLVCKRRQNFQPPCAYSLQVAALESKRSGSPPRLSASE